MATEATSPGVAIFAPLLRSSRLTMTLLSYDDASHVAHIMHVNEAIAKSYGTEPKSFDEFKKRWASFILKPDVCKGLLPPGPAVYLIHEGKDNPTGPIIGTVTLHQRASGLPPDVGFGLTDEYQGKGYGSEAVREVVNYWRHDFGIPGIMLCTSEQNKGAIKLAERIGFVRQAHSTLANDGESLAVYLMPGTDPLPEAMVLNVKM